MATWIVVIISGLAVILALFSGMRSKLTQSNEGKALAFVGILVLPVISGWFGFEEQMTRAESTKFCLSCHVMTDYGKSLLVDDKSYIPAYHFQNNLVPRDHACYTCHTDYAMFGTALAKMRGMRHVLVQYFRHGPKTGRYQAVRTLQQSRVFALPVWAAVPLKKNPKHAKCPICWRISNRIICRVRRANATTPYTTSGRSKTRRSGKGMCNGRMSMEKALKWSSSLVVVGLLCPSTLPHLRPSLFPLLPSSALAVPGGCRNRLYLFGLLSQSSNKSGNS